MSAVSKRLDDGRDSVASATGLTCQTLAEVRAAPPCSINRQMMKAQFSLEPRRLS